MKERVIKEYRWVIIHSMSRKMGNNEALDSTTRRYYLALGAWEMYKDHPVFGVGLGNYYWTILERNPYLVLAMKIMSDSFIKFSQTC